MNTIRHVPKGIEASGPYTPAVETVAGGLRWLHVSGQGTRDPETGGRVPGAIDLQARAALSNLRRVVEGCGFAMCDIVKVTLYLREIVELPAVNAIWAEYFPAEALPARATVAVSGLPGGQSIEIDAVAVRES